MFDAYKTVDEIRKNIVDFIIDWKKIQDPLKREKIIKMWNQEDPSKGSILSELLMENNFPYLQSSYSLRDKIPGELDNLVKQIDYVNNNIENGILPKNYKNQEYFAGNKKIQQRFINQIKDNNFSSDYILYAHQLKAIEASLNDKKNIVISSGTGSGKTEAFLIPTIARILNESDEERAKPGIRAIILYPMNALINNQIKRLQVWLGLQDPSRYPISFGLYNSKLPNDSNNKTKRYKEDASFYANWPEYQIFDRKELRENPPHILVTNYSMLEYALIRPADLPLFAKEKRKLHTIILDEAHTYIGAMAAEITMLLRRTLDAFGKTSKDINFFATSATIGDPKNDDGKALRSFTSDIFSISKDSIEVILGERENILEGKNITENLLINDYIEEVKRLKEEKNLFNISSNSKNLDELTKLGRFAVKVPEVRELIGKIIEKPILINEAQKILNMSNFDKQELILVLKSFSLARFNGKDLLPIRLHLVCNSPQGVYICKKCKKINPFGSHCIHCESDELFEIVSCKKCGKLYAVSNSIRKGVPEWQSKNGIYLFEIDNLKIPISSEKCSVCLNSSKVQTTLSEVETSESFDYLFDEKLRLYKKYFFQAITASNELIQQIILDSIYENLAPEKKISEKMVGEGRKLLSFTDNRQKAARLASRIEWTHDIFLGRRIILDAFENYFSENNQIESFVKYLSDNDWGMFATKKTELILHVVNSFDKYFIKDINVRNSIRDNLVAYHNDFNEGFFPIEDFIELIIQYLEKRCNVLSFEKLKNILSEDSNFCQLTSFIDKSSNDIVKAVYCLLVREFAVLHTNNSLESLGLVAVRFPNHLKLKNEISNNVYLRNMDVDLLISTSDIILHKLRANGRVCTPTAKNNYYDDALFVYANRSIKFLNGSFSLHNSNNIKTSINLIPLKPEPNTFIEIVQKYFNLLSFDESKAVLSELWSCMISVYTKCGLFKEVSNTNLEKDYSINIEKLLFEYKPKVYKCTVCNSMLPYNCNDKCFNRSCNSGVESLSKEWLKENNYTYRRIVLNQLFGMRTNEHTAQIDLNELNENEIKFTKGEINFLSSSTTMELGIDIGGLTAVFLANCPPGSSNYLQRAGRAGRRADNTSLVVTNARKIPIDQYFFYHPDLFFIRKPHTPYVSLSSEKIITRHINSYILAKYFSHKFSKAPDAKRNNNPIQTYGSVKGFFIPDNGIDPFDEFFEWITGPIKWDLDSIDYLLKSTVLELEPIDNCCEDLAYILDKLHEQLLTFHTDLLVKIKQADRDNNSKFKKFLEFQKDNLLDMSLIKFLIENQVLPKYGFPVDVVTLQTKNKFNINNISKNKRSKKDLARLSRQLPLAISEYSPGHEIIVNKRAVISRGLARDFKYSANSDYESSKLVTERFSYVICKNCNHFFVVQNEIAKCPVCGALEKKEKAKNYFDVPKVSKTNSMVSAMIPKGFSVAFGEKQKFCNNFLEKEKTYTKIYPSLAFTAEDTKSILNDNLISQIYTNGQFYAINNGAGFGYVVCWNCGKSEQEDVSGNLSESMKSHNNLQKGEKCDGPANGNLAHHVSLAAKITTDAIKIHLQNQLNPEKFGIEGEHLEVFYRTLARVILIVSAKKLGIDERELAYSIVPIKVDNKFSNHFDIVLYDNVPGGAGYSQLIEEMLFTEDFYNMIEDSLSCPENCSSSCPACVLDFENYESLGEKYNRNLVLQVVEDIRFKHLIEQCILGKGNNSNSKIVLNSKLDFIKQLKTKKFDRIQIVIHNEKDLEFIFENSVYKFITLHLTSGGKMELFFNDELINFSENGLYRYRILSMKEIGIFEIYTTEDTSKKILMESKKENSVYVYSDAYDKVKDISIIDYSKRESFKQLGFQKFIEGKTLKLEKSKSNNFLEINESISIEIIPWKLLESNFPIKPKLKIKKIYYSDRYLATKRQIINLMILFYGMNIDDKTYINIATTPLNSGNTYDTFSSEKNRDSFVKDLLQSFSPAKVKLFTTTVRDSNVPGSQHQRELMIICEEGLKYRFVFDKGMDLVKFKLMRNFNENNIKRYEIEKYNTNIVFLLDENKKESKSKNLEERFLASQKFYSSIIN